MEAHYSLAVENGKAEIFRSPAEYAGDISQDAYKAAPGT
ncbi:hypothetical protein MmTuc01_1651 [Methanosarcina mazei Tuc01]|uniref:Uncharacterized protein n=1 Tax=Methanosarcina mazei Tuc01 TaxID=1236903 RepID=M1PXL3_METMZ|nr:hypothetical protein MmTuc01_1651 [Methanosarcina mazei Tuc01]